MTKIKLYCQGAAARARVEGTLTAGMVGIPVEIVCDSEWDGLIRTLVCMSAEQKIPVVLGDRTPTVAWETLVPRMHLYLGLEGRNAAGDVIIPTTWADCGVVQPGAEQSHSGVPTPTEMEQLLMLAAEAEQTSRQAMALCRNPATAAQVQQAVDQWLDAHPASGLRADGAQENQVPLSDGSGGWCWADLPEAVQPYDDSELRDQVRSLQNDRILPLEQAVSGALDGIAEFQDQVMDSVDGKLSAQQSAADAGKVLTVSGSGAVVPTELSVPDNLVVAEESSADEDAQTVEALLLNRLTLEYDGTYLCLKFGTQELGRVEAIGGSPTVYCTGVTLQQGDMTLDADSAERYLTAAVTPENCTQSLRFVTSNADVATVDADGKLTPVGAGTATITVWCGSFSDSLTVTVANQKLTGWKIRAGYAINTSAGSWATYAQSNRGYCYYGLNNQAPIPVEGGKTYRIWWDDISETAADATKVSLLGITFCGTTKLSATAWTHDMAVETREHIIHTDATADGLTFNVSVWNGSTQQNVADFVSWLEQHIYIKEVTP